MSTKKSDNFGLDLSDLGTDVSSSLIPKDSHFGLSSKIWDEAQKIANTLPIEVQVSGDLNPESVVRVSELAKGSEIQLNYWTEYTSAVTRYLANLKKITSKQSEVASVAASTRLEIAEIEQELGKELIRIESKFRTTQADYRSIAAAANSDLGMSLSKIAQKYTEGRSKAQETLSKSNSPPVETEFQQQTKGLLQKYKEIRASRYSGADAGITRSLK